MAVQAYTSLVLVLSACLVCSSYAYQFNVGGRDGWVTNPSENFNHWAERMRFQVNDTVFFKYNKGSDSVLVVNKDDYVKCQINKPILKMDDGKSIFKFDRSGPFYFISGNKQHCEKGQKIIIVVLAVRNKHQAPSVPTPTKSPAPAGHAPVASPPKGSPAPEAKSPISSPVPAAQPPATAPATRGPVASPIEPPSPVASHKAPSPSPSSETSSPTSLPPSSSTPGSPTSSPAGSSAPTSGNTPADINSPAGSPHRSSAVSAFNPTVMLVSTVSLVISVALGGFI